MAGNGQKGAAEFGLLHIFQHYPFASLLLYDALVIRQVIGGGLHPMSPISCGKNFIYHPDRGGRSQLGIAVLRIYGQIIFNVLQIFNLTK